MDILVIDDLRYWKEAHKPADGAYRYARTSKEAVELLKAQAWAQVWFDHDLGGEDGSSDSIEPVLAYIRQHQPEIDLCFVHSANYHGGNRIQHTLEHLGYTVVRTQCARFFNSF